MSVTKDVIRDLMPVYAAGEASADTRALVESAVRLDPDLAAMLAALREDAPALTPPAPSRATDLVGVERTKGLLRQRTGFLAAAVVGTLVPFTFAFSGTDLRFFMLRDAPLVAVACLACALSFWIAYGVTVRRLRVRGL